MFFFCCCFFLSYFLFNLFELFFLYTITPFHMRIALFSFLFWSITIWYKLLILLNIFIFMMIKSKFFDFLFNQTICWTFIIIDKLKRFRTLLDIFIFLNQILIFIFIHLMKLFSTTAVIAAGDHGKLFLQNEWRICNIWTQNDLFIQSFLWFEINYPPSKLS